MATISSAAGILSMIDDPNQELKTFALKRLDSIVDQFWPEIADEIEKIEALYEDVNFSNRELAALVISKVYFHLGVYDVALNYALGAGLMFDVEVNSEYVNTIIGKCIDSYVDKRKSPSETKIDSRQEDIVNLMLERCLRGKEFKQAMGVAIEAKRLDIFERSIAESENVHQMLTYSYGIVMSMVEDTGFRNELLRKLCSIYARLPEPNYVQMCQCLIYLNDPHGAASVLHHLAKGSDEDALMAYQIAFDLYESCTQQFLTEVTQTIKSDQPLSRGVSVLSSNSVLPQTDTEPETTVRSPSTNPSIESESINREGAKSVTFVLDSPKDDGSTPQSSNSVESEETPHVSESVLREVSSTSQSSTSVASLRDPTPHVSGSVPETPPKKITELSDIIEANYFDDESEKHEYENDTPSSDVSGRPAYLYETDTPQSIPEGKTGGQKGYESMRYSEEDLDDDTGDTRATESSERAAMLEAQNHSKYRSGIPINKPPMPLPEFLVQSQADLSVSSPDSTDESGSKKEYVAQLALDHAQSSPELTDFERRIAKLALILSGDKTIELHLQFLYGNDHSDLVILRLIKTSSRLSTTHTATIIANSYMHAGTTHDTFLRDNLDWLQRATNWAKFTATASLGVIHRGHEKEAMSVMAGYLPKPLIMQSRGFAEGGALYALGLIHTNHGSNVIPYLLENLRISGYGPISHGACLGLGLAALGTRDNDAYESLLNALKLDDAVFGDAAGIALGMVEVGARNNRAVEEMTGFAKQTEHEKIVRGLAIGIALTCFTKEELADELINVLSNEEDAILRRSAMYTIAMAYAGTGSNKAIRKLLHFAVSDVNDDVRRNAIMMLGFILFKNSDQCPDLVSLLAESYNPHVRYGSALALGIACCGTGNQAAIDLLEPMLDDNNDFVRQGALIASAMVMIQHTDATCPTVTKFRAAYTDIILNKHEGMMAKLGAILSHGIIDAGGRNVTISLKTRAGHTNTTAVVGMLVFTQYWYWYPLSHFLSLTFTPSALIALNENLEMPKVSFRSNARPSTFGYPAMREEKKTKGKKMVSTAVLSVTAKHNKRLEEKRKSAGPVVTDEPTNDAAPREIESLAVESEEPDHEVVLNPARILNPQLKHMSLLEDDRFMPMKDLKHGGIVLLKSLVDEPFENIDPLEVETPGEIEPPPSLEQSEEDDDEDAEWVQSEEEELSEEEEEGDEEEGEGEDDESGEKTKKKGK